MTKLPAGLSRCMIVHNGERFLDHLLTGPLRRGHVGGAAAAPTLGIRRSQRSARRLPTIVEWAVFGDPRAGAAPAHAELPTLLGAGSGLRAKSVWIAYAS